MRDRRSERFQEYLTAMMRDSPADALELWPTSFV
jgi:hypothetical protein